MPRPDSTQARSGGGAGEDQGSRTVVVREVGTAREYEACVDLQRAVWGQDFSGCVPPSLLRVVSEAGGVVAGAFEGERLLGFVLGLTALRQGELAHWSHMLAVRREARGRGLGTRLKLCQRDLLLAKGIQVAYWTFDPLMARNAYLNLVRLGGEAVEYCVDMYGSETGSQLHGEVATDRLVVRWRLESKLVLAAIERREATRTTRGGMDASGPQAVAVENGGPKCVDPLPSDRRIVVPIPSGFEDVLTRSAEMAERWRSATRQAFQGLMRRGYRVTGFGACGQGRSGYLLERAHERSGVGRAS